MRNRDQIGSLNLDDLEPPNVSSRSVVADEYCRFCFADHSLVV